MEVLEYAFDNVVDGYHNVGGVETFKQVYLVIYGFRMSILSLAVIMGD